MTNTPEQQARAIACSCDDFGLNVGSFHFASCDRQTAQTLALIESEAVKQAKHCLVELCLRDGVHNGLTTGLQGKLEHQESIAQADSAKGTFEQVVRERLETAFTKVVDDGSQTTIVPMGRINAVIPDISKAHKAAVIEALEGLVGEDNEGCVSHGLEWFDYCTLCCALRGRQALRDEQRAAITKLKLETRE